MFHVVSTVAKTSPNKLSSKAASNSFVGGSGIFNSNCDIGINSEESGAKKPVSSGVEFGVFGAKSLEYCMKKMKETGSFGPIGQGSEGEQETCQMKILSLQE